MKPDMHKQLQNSVCFQLRRRAEGNSADYITLYDVVIFLLLLVDMYAMDSAAAAAAKYILVPWLYGIQP